MLLGSYSPPATYPAASTGTRARLCRIQTLQSGDLRRDPGLQRIERAQLILPRDEQGAARRQHRMVGEPAGLIPVERVTGGGQRADYAIAVGWSEDRGRAAGRVVAWLALALEQDNLGESGDLVGGRRPGDAGADDQDVARLHPSSSLRTSVPRGPG
jgi:hypothetical protein